MAFVVTRFELVSAAEVEAEKLAKAPEQFGHVWPLAVI
jgi:hypothetical protein